MKTVLLLIRQGQHLSGNVDIGEAVIIATIGIVQVVSGLATIGYIPFFDHRQPHDLDMLNPGQICLVQ